MEGSSLLSRAMSRTAQAGVPLRVSADAAIARQQAVTGRVPLNKLSRLREAAAEGDGWVQVEWQFGRDRDGRARLAGSLEAEVPLVCQRCLQTFAWHGEMDADWRLVRSEAEEARVLKECEPILVEDDWLHLHELMQDEVLLALPLIPHCSDPACDIGMESA